MASSYAMRATQKWIINKTLYPNQEQDCALSPLERCMNNKSENFRESDNSKTKPKRS